MKTTQKTLTEQIKEWDTSDIAQRITELNAILPNFSSTPTGHAPAELIERIRVYEAELKSRQR